MACCARKSSAPAIGPAQKASRASSSFCRNSAGRLRQNNPSSMRTHLAVRLIAVVAFGLLACDAQDGAIAASDRSGDATTLTVAPRVGHLAPDFALTTLDGREV